MNSLQLAREAASAARASYREGFVAPTAGQAPGLTQCNMITLPREWAYDFLLFAQRNPQACPVLDVTEPGSHTTLLAEQADLRTDLPLYRVWRDGQLAEELSDVSHIWAQHTDLVSFLIGCSFTFETDLMHAGIDAPDRRGPGCRSGAHHRSLPRCARRAGTCRRAWTARHHRPGEP
ncbi:hypothetical protein ALO42_02010 [Pseudomonas syringae pv. atrofaciens]|nr:hypothetical protein ALO42_02010 [Pseudomonas syringae pv. atrofaciens]